MIKPSFLFQRALLAPRHWPTWLGLALIWLVARLPYPWLIRFGKKLGWLTARIMRSRRQIAARNLEICFPEKSILERAQLLEAHMCDLGLMLVEFAFAWMGSKHAVANIPVHIEGLEYLNTARKAGRGVLLVGAHFSHLELAGRLLAQHVLVAGMYRPHSDQAFEWAIKRARLCYADAMFSKDEIRQTLKYLKGSGVLWYAPDQGMRGKDAVFVPFFGIDVPTITATHHLARLSGAYVIPFFHKRRTDGGYDLRLETPLDNFPSADVAADTTRINQLIERMVREAPEQYLWVHQRFKTRPQREG